MVRKPGRSFGRFYPYKDGYALVKQVNPDKHYFRSSNGYAIDLGLVRELDDNDIVIIHELEKDGLTVSTNLQTLKAKGERIEIGRYGRQIVLNLKYWDEFDASLLKQIVTD